MLREVLITLATSNDHVRRLVAMHAAGSEKSSANHQIDALIKQIHDAIVPAEYVREEDEYDHAAGVDHVISVLRGGLTGNSVAEVREMCRYAIDCAAEATELLAEGCMLVDQAKQLVDIHQAACRAVPPDSAALVKWVKGLRKTDLGASIREALDAYSAIIR